MNYIVRTPNGKDVSIGLQYGSVVLQNGQIVPESYVTRAFPELFIPVKEEVKKEPVIIETQDLVRQTETVKKAGRPKKNSFSKG